MTEQAVKTRNGYMKEWREQHREKVNSYGRKWRSENKDKVKQYNQTYWEKKATEAVTEGTKGAVNQ
jgi:hypothetical protein